MPRKRSKNRRVHATLPPPPVLPVGFEPVELGDGVGVVIPLVPDRAPAVVKEGLARRRVAVLEGRCPCGAAVPDQWVPDGVTQLVFTLDHAEGCPADHHLVVGWVMCRLYRAGWVA